MKTALYLSGGGARGAYQVGVMQAIAEITQAQTLPFDILSSVSVGAINAALLATHTNDFQYSTRKLQNLWAHLQCDDIYQANNLALAKSAIRNLTSIMFHSMPKGGGYLLDTRPLKQLLDKNINFHSIKQHIQNKRLLAFEIAATCYEKAKTFSFYDAYDTKLGWKRSRHISAATKINSAHILASSALPLFFPAIEIDGFHYGDGGVHLASPLRAAINLGADKILIIGTRRLITQDHTKFIPQPKGISFASTLGNMLNALFLDNLDRDYLLIKKINRILTLIPPKMLDKTNWRKIKVLYISPSADLGALSATIQHRFPLLFRYLLSNLGHRQYSSDLLSLLIFESDYCQQLIKIGYDDAIAQKRAVVNFFNDDD